ncbi:hypothetical protein HK101_010223 [Irineochytrium annulatum]|nr:hypothetical protein HK101_010223 [Irineochytrium annulatum]
MKTRDLHQCTVERVNISNSAQCQAPAGANTIVDDARVPLRVSGTKPVSNDSMKMVVPAEDGVRPALSLHNQRALLAQPLTSPPFSTSCESSFPEHQLQPAETVPCGLSLLASLSNIISPSSPTSDSNPSNRSVSASSSLECSPPASESCMVGTRGEEPGPTGLHSMSLEDASEDPAASAGSQSDSRLRMTERTKTTTSNNDRSSPRRSHDDGDSHRSDTGASSPLKVHVCPYCPSQFTRKQNLRSHLSTHTLDKPHACVEGGCDARFRRRQEMLRHHRSVHGGVEARPWCCPGKGCGRRFARGDALKRHLEAARSFGCRMAAEKRPALE